MCACRCGIKVHLKNGRVRYIQGNPAHPVNRGVLCAKGSAGIMQHYSPARLTKPLLRTGERGVGEFREIGWDEALEIATKWLGAIRASDPDKLAFFTGRDQSQALTGWWAQQFGTINYAAHGGFCSVNMAAAGMYTIGGSFWEFGEPDWELTKYLLMFGVAEDHDSNPIKLGLGKLKGRGAKIVAINPVRTGYAAIADEWIGIRPGTDGLFIGALIRELLRTDRIDLDYLVKYTNAHHLVVRRPGGADDGLIARDAHGRPLCAARGETGMAIVAADAVGISPCVVGEFTLEDGRTAVPAFQLLAERFLGEEYDAGRVAERCGVDAATMPLLRRKSACLNAGRTRTAANMRRWSAGRYRCTRCAVSARTRTDSRPAACCTCCRCCSARSTRPEVSATSRRTRKPCRPQTGPARRARRTARSMPVRSATCTDPRTCSSTPPARRAASTRRSRGSIRSPRTACCRA